MALAPLLLATFLAASLLNVDAFHGDELASLMTAGITESGPRNLAEVSNYVTERDPNQAQGWPMLVFFWGRIFGWHETVVRALPLFAGLLTIAWTFRVGSQFLAPMAGHFAAIFLATSVFLVAYMAHARSFTFVSLATITIIWSYWRIASSDDPAAPLHRWALWAAASILLWSHYLASLLLLSLGMYHLLLAPRSRRWWWPVVLLSLALLLALLQIPGLLEALRFVSDLDLSDRILSPASLLSHFTRNLGNGFVFPAPPLDNLLLLALPVVGVYGAWLLRKSANRIHVIGLISFVAITYLVLVIIANEFLGIIVDNRIRYLMPLWPLMALLAGAFLWRVQKRRPRLVILILALWLCLAVWQTLATPFRYELGYFFRSSLHRTAAALAEHVDEQDGLVVRLDSNWDGVRRDSWMVQAGKMRFPFNVYLSNSRKTELMAAMISASSSHPFVWLLRHYPSLATALPEVVNTGTVFCERVLNDRGYKLERFTGTETQCPNGSPRLEFEADILWGGAFVVKDSNTLQVEVHLYSDDSFLLDSYSLALHVIDPATGERVAQGDVGVGPGTFALVRSDIDVSALPPGDYELQVALYNWQTGERLDARDPATDVVSDMHVLHRFHID